MNQVRSTFKGKRGNSFWELIVQKKISLITCDESEDSEVQQSEANKVFSLFLFFFFGSN